MLVTIKGEVTQKSLSSVVVETAGLGYEIFVSTHDLESLTISEPAELHLLEYIREDAHNLYGFKEPEAKILFEQLISVSGVGPKVAMAILSGIQLERLKSAIASSNSDVLQTVSGVGKKMAERIVVDLRNKIVAAVSEPMSEGGDTVFEALRQLGYSVQQSHQAIADIPADVKGDEHRIKAALKQLGSNQQ